jgi:hypothetical protein
VRRQTQEGGGGNGGVTLSAIRRGLGLECVAQPAEDCAVETGFASDVLSAVLARAPRGCLLVTMQTNINVVAVASYAGVAGVNVTSGNQPGAEVLARAAEEGIGMYCTAADTFEVVSALARMGVKGRAPGERGSEGAPGGGDEKFHG